MHIDRIKKYLLDTDYQPWRTSDVQTRFKDNGLEVERFAGIHGTAFGMMPTTTVWDNPRDGEQKDYRISPGQCSIAVNKIMLLQHILDMGDEETIIFENDVTFIDNFREEFEKSYNALPSTWDACHIGHYHAGGKPRTIINDRITKIEYPLCCHALMFKRDAIKVALEQLKRNYCGTPSDTVLQRMVYPKLNHYCFVPELCFQDGTHSEAAQRLNYLDAQGWFDWQRLYDEWLTDCDDRPSTIVEIGTWKGRSIIYLAEEAKRRLKPNVSIYAVDHWRGNADEPNMAEMIKAANGDIWPEFWYNINRCGVADWIKPLRMSSVEGAAQFGDGTVDRFFLDAGHSFEDVTADLNAWWPKLKPGGRAAGHDVHAAGVRRAINEFCAKIGRPYRTWDQCWIID